jgi:hypothetical protein
VNDIIAFIFDHENDLKVSAAGGLAADAPFAVADLCAAVLRSLNQAIGNCCCKVGAC